MLHLNNNTAGSRWDRRRTQDFVKLGTKQIVVPGPIKTSNNLDLLKKNNSLIDLFNKYFEIVPADTAERLLQAYRLRYEVYCKEAQIPGFRPEDYPQGLEYDQYDQRSVHSLLMHKPTGRLAGVVRIILPDRDKPDIKFPLEKFASDSFYTNIASLKNLPRSHLGEISRLIIAPEFRGRQGENWYLYSILNNSRYLLQNSHQRKTYILKTDFDYRKKYWWHTSPYTTILGLFVAIVRMSIKHDLKYWYAGMTQGHARGLYRIFGINFMPVSPLVDYYGPCRSYLGYIPDIMEGIYRTNHEIWNLLTNNGALITGSNHLNVL